MCGLQADDDDSRPVCALQGNDDDSEEEAPATAPEISEDDGNTDL